MIKKVRIKSTLYKSPRGSLFDTLPGEIPPDMDFPERISVDEMEIFLKELKLSGWEIDRGGMGCAIWWHNQSLRYRTWIYRLVHGDEYYLVPDNIVDKYT